MVTLLVTLDGVCQLDKRKVFGDIKKEMFISVSYKLAIEYELV